MGRNPPRLIARHPPPARRKETEARRTPPGVAATTPRDVKPEAQSCSTTSIGRSSHVSCRCCQNHNAARWCVGCCSRLSEPAIVMTHQRHRLTRDDMSDYVLTSKKSLFHRRFHHFALPWGFVGVTLSRYLSSRPSPNRGSSSITSARSRAHCVQWLGSEKGRCSGNEGSACRLG
jgi:hypothetical protein